MRLCIDCSTLTDLTRCEPCRKAKRRAADARRPSSTERGYGAHWRRVRRQFLRDNPTCVDCGQPATVPDHSPLTRAQLVAKGIPDPDAPAFLVPRCKPCHDRKTVEQDGGFGRQTSGPGWPD